MVFLSYYPSILAKIFNYCRADEGVQNNGEMGRMGVMLRFVKMLCLVTVLAGLFGEEQDVVIIGGGPAGLTAAIYVGRGGLKTVLIEGEEPGGQITYSHNVENYPGFPKGIEGADLSLQMREQAIQFGASMLSGTVVEADLSKRPFRLKLKGGKELFAKSVIIAVGSRTRWLGPPSETLLKGKGVNSCAICDGFLYKNKEVVVVGGGDSAIEEALYLANLASHVTVIHRGNSLRASKTAQDAAFQNNKISFIYDSTVEEILDVKKEQVEGVRIKNRVTGKESVVPCSGVFIAIGHIPNTEIFKHTLPLNKDGYIRLEPHSTKTTIPGVFAAGDVADPYYRQAVIAAGFGSMAAIDALHFIQENYRKESL